MAKKKLNAEDAIKTSELITNATGAQGELFNDKNAEFDNSVNAAFNVKPIKRKRKKEPTKDPAPVGRPPMGRTAILTLKLQPEIKDYLRLRSFELTTSDNVVSMADIVEEMLIKEMKKYYRNKAKKEGADE